jgi:small-conductance mechanosensitive channel
MNDALISAGLLALTVAAVIFTRARGLLVKMAVEIALLATIGSFLLSQGASPLPHFKTGPVGIADAWLRALAIIWWLVGARLVVNLTTLARGRDAKSREARLFSDLTAAVIYIAAILIILNFVLDLNIAGVVATSGVIAIILGLALQNTLADVFAGIAVGVEQPFRVGDRVSISDSVEGTVVQMNWRSVRIQTDDDNLATIPNSLVAKGQVINQSAPSRRRFASVEIAAPASVAAETVIELMRQATLRCPGILATPAPSLTIKRAGLASCTYAVGFFVADTPLIAGAKSQLLRQIRRLFHHAGINRPTPMSTVERLGSLVLFEALSPAELEALAATLITRSTEPDEVIFHQGAPSTSIFVIEAGVLEISRRLADGTSGSLGRIGPGEYIGELGLITNLPRAYSLTSLTHGRMLELPGASLTHLLSSNTALSAAMERSVRRGMAMLDRDDAARAVHPVEEATDLFARIRAYFGV